MPPEADYVRVVGAAQQDARDGQMVTYLLNDLDGYATETAAALGVVCCHEGHLNVIFTCVRCSCPVINLVIA